MADVFLSYKKEDVALADRIVLALRNEGFEVWWDDGLTPREAWDSLLEREIAAAATVVVLWSPRSVASDWVRTEAHYGQDRGKLVPVMVEPCTLPIAFMLKQTVNLAGWNGDRADKQWRKLLTWIADLAATKPGNANIPQALVAAAPNRFRDAVGHTAAGDPICDGALVNASTPAGTAFRDGDAGPVMRIVPSGSFDIGSPSGDPDRTFAEGPQKQVTIAAPFAIGIFPVLCGEYDTFGAAQSASNAAQEKPSGWFGKLLRSAPPADVVVATSPVWPVTDVSFDDAQDFVERLSASTGEAYRIPSESEWEYACRAGSRTRYSCGDTIDAAKARFGATDGAVQPGSFAANAFGLYDMHGNVREWTADLWHESLDATPQDGKPALDGHGSMQVVRGGGWSDGAPVLRSAARMRCTRSVRVAMIGFRVARALR